LAADSSYPLGWKFYKAHTLEVRMLNLNLKITDKEKIVRGRRDSDAKAIPLNFEKIDKDEDSDQLFSEKKLIS